MTYAQFLLLFLILPLVACAVLLRRRLFSRRYAIPAVALMLIAIVYMAPWDHTAAVWGLWTWTRGQTWGVRLWAIPPEEYLFCLLEALLAVTLSFAVYTWRAGRGGTAADGDAARVRKEEPRT